MIIFEILSAIAALLAGLPELYFYVKLRKSKSSYALMSLSIFLAFLFHAITHLLHFLEITTMIIYIFSILSALMIIVFAILFYYNQNGEINGK